MVTRSLVAGEAPGARVRILYWPRFKMWKILQAISPYCQNMVTLLTGEEMGFVYIKKPSNTYYHFEVCFCFKIKVWSQNIFKMNAKTKSYLICNFFEHYTEALHAWYYCIHIEKNTLLFLLTICVSMYRGKRLWDIDR